MRKVGLLMWLSAIKLAMNAGTHIYKKKQETKMAMADAQHMHAARMASGEEAIPGKAFRKPVNQIGRTRRFE